jgi:hypothetical protein
LSRLGICGRKQFIDIAAPAYRVLCTTGNFPSYTSVRDMLVAFQIQYVYDYITKLCRKQAKVIQKHENVRCIGQGEAQHKV